MALIKAPLASKFYISPALTHLHIEESSQKAVIFQEFSIRAQENEVSIILFIERDGQLSHQDREE
jgi:hypothetical protein